MELRFCINPDTGDPHIFDHHVYADEVRDVLRKPLEEIRGRNGSKLVLGQTRAGRYLKIICVPDEQGDGIFIVTAFDLPARQVRALRRRMRR